MTGKVLVHVDQEQDAFLVGFQSEETERHLVAAFLFRGYHRTRRWRRRLVVPGLLFCIQRFQLTGNHLVLSLKLLVPGLRRQQRFQDILAAFLGLIKHGLCFTSEFFEILQVAQGPDFLLVIGHQDDGNDDKGAHCRGEQVHCRE